MKIKSNIIVLVVCLVARGFSEKIQCYECEDCKGIGHLMACPADAAVTQQTTTIVTTPKTDVTQTTDSSTLAAEPTTEVKSIPPESTESPTSSAQPPESPSVLAADGIVSARFQPFREISFKRRLSRRSIQDSSNFFCYRIEITDGDRNKTRKGCVEVPHNVTGCSILEAQYAVRDGSCAVCLSDKCNDGATFKYSLTILFIVTVMSFNF